MLLTRHDTRVVLEHLVQRFGRVQMGNEFVGQQVLQSTQFHLWDAALTLGQDTAGEGLLEPSFGIVFVLDAQGLVIGREARLDAALFTGAGRIGNVVGGK